MSVPKQHLTYKVNTLRHDGGRADFGNKAFEKLLHKYSITREKTTGASTGNVKAERRIGVSSTDSLTEVSSSHGPRNWWSYSMAYSVVTRTNTPTNARRTCPCLYHLDALHSLLLTKRKDTVTQTTDAPPGSGCTLAKLTIDGQRYLGTISRNDF